MKDSGVYHRSVMTRQPDEIQAEECGERTSTPAPTLLCPVEEAARIVGQKWTLQIVHSLMGHERRRFCELQEALGGVNPSTLSSRLKMLEEEGLVQRIEVSSIPPHVEYRLTPMGQQLSGVIGALTEWSRSWLCHSEIQGIKRVTPDLLAA